LEVQGYLGPTPIQAQAIPVVLSGRDLLAAAQTGTGKTAGFTLPLLHRLRERQRQERAARGESPAEAGAPSADGASAPASEEAGATGAQRSPHPKRRPSVLILVPTRELAAQVNACVRTYGRFMFCRTVVIFGGVNANQQIAELRRGADIVVATPGRLLDHAGENAIDLSGIDTLVLDEADRMLDMGFIHDIRRVLALLPVERQNLLFSATFSDEIRALANGFLRDPVTVEVAPRNKPIELISQVVHPVDRERRRALLTHLIKTNDWRQVLVFCKTKHGANRLAEQLTEDGIDADAIHGNKSQNARTRALERFRANESRALVATDIAARGLDIEGLPHVVNYDLPHVPEDYVHRIGRTGRAGSEGEAVTLLCGEERELLAAIEKLIKRPIERAPVAGFEPSPEWETARYEPDQRQGGRGQQQRRPQRGQERKPAPDAAPATPPTEGVPSANAESDAPREQRGNRPNNPQGPRNNRGANNNRPGGNAREDRGGNGRDGRPRGQGGPYPNNRPARGNGGWQDRSGYASGRPAYPSDRPAYATDRPAYAIQGYATDNRAEIENDEELDQKIDGNRVDYRGNGGGNQPGRRNGGGNGAGRGGNWNANRGGGNWNRPNNDVGGWSTRRSDGYNRPYRQDANPYGQGPMQSGRSDSNTWNRKGPVAPHESRLHENATRPDGGKSGKRRSPGALLTGLPKDED
jgi:ATP-dependent RNA helicase RhlE